MALSPDPVDAILATHGIAGAWRELPVTGVANRIYATRDIVLRVATEHPDAIADARTESVAAPVVRAAGIRVPRLIVFDDSRTLVERPYSLWGRVYAETLSIWAPQPCSAVRTWRELGAELARLHDPVRACADPRAWLDHPSMPDDVLDSPADLVARRLVDVASAERLERWLGEGVEALARLTAFVREATGRWRRLSCR